MNITLKTISRLPGCKGLEIVAGEKGLDNEIKWTAIIDCVDLIEFSNEGDLNFVTGLAMHNDDDVLELTREACRYKMAGIVFAPGGLYIDRLPQSVIDFGNENDFPIFTIPWESKISDYAKAIGHYIIEDTYHSRSLVDILRAILTGKESLPFSQQVQTQLNTEKLTSFEKYCVGYITVAGCENCRMEDYRTLYSELFKAVGKVYDKNAIPVPMKKSISLIFFDTGVAGCCSPQKLELINEVFDDLAGRCEGCEFRIGFGREYNKMELLSNSYNEAVLVVNLMSQARQRKQGIYHYDDMGFYKILWESKNQTAAINFSRSTLKKLEDYDSSNNSDLVEFLETYIDCNGSVKETSERMYLHKNTVLYKLKKIRMVSGYDLSNLDDMFNLQFAIKVKHLFYK